MSVPLFNYLSLLFFARLLKRAIFSANRSFDQGYSLSTIN